LNALDGVRSQEGQILFMTTNHKERLDPALLRPGRADVHVNLNYASEKQIKQLFERFFPEAQDKSEDFSNKLPVYKLSMAKVQGHLLKYREDPQVCIEKAQELLDDDLRQIKEMPIAEWLHRLNLLKLQKNFDDQKMRRVTDLIYIVD
jgi:chaperone BCS1